MEILVGYTGFVGSNLANKHHFDAYFNSKNIQEAFGLNPDLLVYAGVRAEKYLANLYPQKDRESILEAINNIKQINPKKLVLISTIDIYPNAINVDENSRVEFNDLQPYGKHRYELEQWVKENIHDYLILRLPGLFGINLKKNFIYDYIQVIPQALNEIRYNQMIREDLSIESHYLKGEDQFYRYQMKNIENHMKLKQELQNTMFHAMYFTDSEASFQFYPLAYLWDHIQIALENQLSVLNLAVAPIQIKEIIKVLENRAFLNKCSDHPACYDMKTCHAELFGGKESYIFDKNRVVEEIIKFIQVMK